MRLIHLALPAFLSAAPMYKTCLFCNQHLGANRAIPSLPVGRRLAFDAERGRLWVVCMHCGRWNLTPLEERWEAIEECERQFRGTALRFSTDNIGLAQLRDGLQLIRIGRALRPEFAAWRYGRYLRRWGQPAGSLFGHAADGAALLAGRVARATARAIPPLRPRYDAVTWLRIHRQGNRILGTVALAGGDQAIIRYRHLEAAELIRPDAHEPWRLLVRHDQGEYTLTGDAGLRTAGKLLAAINGFGATTEQIRYAIRKLDDAGDPDGYFARIAALALRTSWGLFPDAPRNVAVVPVTSSDAERLALYLTNRSFWGRGGIGSETRTALPRLPVEDRLALEMAANEDTERRALQGELTELEAAWREAEEIAEISDSMFFGAGEEGRPGGTPPPHQPTRWLRRLFPAPAPAGAG